MQAEKNIAIRTWLKWKWYIKPEVTQAEVVLFEANLARSPALRSFLIEKSMDAEG